LKSETNTGTAFALPGGTTVTRLVEETETMIRSRTAALALLFAVSWHTTPARADVPPPDACTTAGSECSNAGDDFDEPGTCFLRTCTKGPPGEEVEYECLRCEKPGEGGGGAGGAGGSANGEGGEKAGPGGAATTGGSSPTPPKDDDDDDDDGCSVSYVGTEHGLAGLMLFLGVALLRRGRRR
jgi:hypothetical protein